MSLPVRWSFYLAVYHLSVCLCTGEDIVFMATDIGLLGNVDWVMLQSCFDAHFLLVLEKQDLSPDGVQTFFAIVQLIGTNKQADNFIYRSLSLLLVIFVRLLF